MAFDRALLTGDWYSRNNPAQYAAGQSARIHPVDEIAGRIVPTLNRKLVLVSFDVEYPSELAEVGVAWLRLSDVENIAPGKHGINWHEYIHARHFRNTRCPKYFPRRFNVGCPDHFQHGRSEWVDVPSLASTLDDCFYQIKSGRYQQKVERSTAPPPLIQGQRNVGEKDSNQFPVYDEFYYLLPNYDCNRPQGPRYGHYGTKRSTPVLQGTEDGSEDAEHDIFPHDDDAFANGNEERRKMSHHTADSGLCSSNVPASDLPASDLPASNHAASRVPDTGNGVLEGVVGDITEEETVELIKSTCADNLKGMACRRRHNCPARYHCCPGFNQYKPTCFGVVCADPRYIHLRTTCPSVIRRDACNKAGDCTMAHDFAEERIAVYKQRREDSRRHNAAVRAEEKGSHPGRAEARKRKRQRQRDKLELGLGLPRTSNTR